MRSVPVRLCQCTRPEDADGAGRRSVERFQAFTHGMRVVSCFIHLHGGIARADGAFTREAWDGSSTSLIDHILVAPDRALRCGIYQGRVAGMDHRLVVADVRRVVALPDAETNTVLQDMPERVFGHYTCYDPRRMRRWESEKLDHLEGEMAKMVSEGQVRTT